MKSLFANVAVGLFAASLWDMQRLNRVASILFLLFLPINVPGFVNPVVAAVRILGMLALLSLSAMVLWRGQSS
jgi:hypothetical protein